MDGQAHPVLTRSDAKTLLIRLPAVAPPPPAAPVAEGEAQPAAPAHATTFNAVTQTHRIEFRGYPIIHAVAGRQWMEFTLPRLNAASWTMRNEHPGSPWTIQTGEVSQTVAPGQSWVRELGPVTRLRIEPAAATPTLKPVVEARLALLADVQPAVSQLQYQVAYRVLQGQVSNVAWQLPAGLAVREVTGPEVFDWHITPATGGISVLQVDLQSPVSEGFTIRVKGWMSNDGPPTQVTIPPVLLLTPNREPLRPVVALVGVRTPAEFLPEAPADLGEQIASATVEAFVTEWGTAGLAQPPQVAFSVFDPAPLKVGLRPLAAQRVVRLTSIGVLGSRRLQWTVNATIEVQTAAAYSHQIDVDPRMTVTSVTIQEDAANRLLRWTRTGNVLHVFLRDKTTGTQSLTLQGTMPAQVPQEMALPTVKFLDATVADARLQLYQEPDLEVEVSDPGKWEQLEVPSEVRLGAARNLLVGRFKWDPAAGPFIISAKQNEPLLTYSAVTSLQPRDGRWKLRTNLLFEVQRGHGSQFSIRVPPELPVVAVDAADVRQLFDAEPGGGQRIVLIPQAPVRGRFVVQVSGDLNLPPGGTGIIPEIVGLNATRKDHFVVLPVDGPLAVDPRNSGLTPTPLPSELAKLLPTELQGMKQAEYLGTPGTWAVTVSRPQEVVPQSGVLWSETQIWCGPPRQLSGRTTILLGPRDDEQIKLTIPAGIELRGVLLDGEFRPQASTVEQQLLIPLAYPQSGHVIILYWTRTTASFEGLFNRAEFQWPHVTGVRVMEQYATITPPTGFRLHARQGRQAERVNVQLGELQSLLRLMEQRFAGGAAVQDPQWMYLQRHVAGLVRRLDAETRLLGGTDETGARFAKLREQFRPWDLVPNAAESSVTSPGISPATLRSFASLEGNLAGPHSILVQCGSEAGQSSLNVSIIRESLWSWGLGLSLALGIALAAWPLYRWKFPEWLAEQPSVAWLLLGLLWWLCLTPSWLGVVWLSLSGIYASRQIWRSYLPPLSPPGDDRSELAQHL